MKKIRKKFLIMYILCVILPLIIVDGLLALVLIRAERNELAYHYEDQAKTVETRFRNSVDYAANMAVSISMNKALDDFLAQKYKSPFDYYDSYYNYTSIAGTLLRAVSNNVLVTIYTDNDTIVNGGQISRLDTIRDVSWYKEFKDSGKDSLIIFYYDEAMTKRTTKERRLYFIKRMNFYDSKSESIVAIEIRYNELGRTLSSGLEDDGMYICSDGKVIFSHPESGGSVLDYEEYVGSEDEEGYRDDFSLYGKDISVIITKTVGTVSQSLWKYWWLFVIVLIINAILPWFCMRMLQTAFNEQIRSQQMDIARQNAELHALHSQINPHFLFNALESIRMHSILRNEYETAEMVEMLAVIERKNADWNEDSIEIRNEIEFVEAYLRLQKYRFGDRLSYEIDIADDCEHIMIPRLTIVTFVENACVHGIEGKTSEGWIFVRAYKRDGKLVIEVEDTGGGIGDDKLDELLDKMRNASIEKLTEKGRIGIVNACLRIKMATEQTAEFYVESEEGIGTTFQIIIPLKTDSV